MQNFVSMSIPGKWVHGFHKILKEIVNEIRTENYGRLVASKEALKDESSESIYSFSIYNIFTLNSGFSTLAAHWNYLGNLKKYCCLGLMPRKSDLIGLGCGLRTEILTAPPRKF